MISTPATLQVLSYVEPFAAPRSNAKHLPSKKRPLPLTVTLSEATLDAFRYRVLYPDTLAGVTDFNVHGPLGRYKNISVNFRKKYTIVCRSFFYKKKLRMFWTIHTSRPLGWRFGLRKEGGCQSSSLIFARFAFRFFVW